MKRVLIITTFFAPCNAADMHRIRQSLAYYKENGWEAELVTVDDKYVEMTKDELLLLSIPEDLKIHKVKALKPGLTKIFGLGSIAYRSMYFYWKYVNRLLKEKKFDLVFFSTTAFPVCLLGRLWKYKHHIPYVIDMQDPWRSDQYLNKPKNERPPKFWLSYTLDSILEKFTMKKVDGLISVSQTYIDVLKDRYIHLNKVPAEVIPFAAFQKDIEICKSENLNNNIFNINDGFKHITYIGRGGKDMYISTHLILSALRKGLMEYNEFEKIRMYFVGTSYDSSGNAEQTIFPIAKQLGVEKYVIEITNRVPYYESLLTLNQSDVLMVPGSDNIGYTASKIYPYVWFNKPLFTVFHSSSSVNKFMNEVNVGSAIQFDLESEEIIIDKITKYIYQAITSNYESQINWEAFEKYTAPFQTKRQCLLFNKVINERTV